MKILLGPAGSGGLGNLKGVEEVKKVGLQAMECEFTYGVNMANAVAKDVGDLAKKLGIKLSVHAPYYINLSSKENEKIRASKKRLLDSCERAHYLGAENVVFHPGFYQGRDPEQIFEKIREEIIDLQKVVQKNKWGVKLAPETTGKINVFGNVEETLRLVKETGCSFCIDFAHIKARQQGKIDYEEVFGKLKKFNDLHCHFSGIEYTSKGERNHKITELGEITELGKGLLKANFRNVTIINESPDPFGDSLKTKKI
ncbi:TIM barrel protein, partial [Candidatus Woesearchaeota archaeon]|nr:TIM barrel protein [Candidatus Woesearchaeota archaeon]